MTAKVLDSHTDLSNPAEFAARLGRRSGFAWLDSSLATFESLSILSAEPSLVLEGGREDWPLLEKELRLRKSESGADLGYPDGAAIGWVGFDGKFRFGFYDRLWIYNHGSESWLRSSPVEPGPEPLAEAPGPMPEFSPLLSKEEFCRMVRRAQEYIASGDIYQACLSHPFSAQFSGSAWDYYRMLRHFSPAPYSAFLDLGGTQVASSSPECFLRMSGSRVTTRPIKGTRPRRADTQLDQRNAYDLLTSPKEIAELVMITDLERNDLGRICEYGSVTVPDLLKIEHYEQVHHLVSTVEGTLRADVSHPAALLSCFPGGSISGAPKKRALEIIAELEPYPRGIYTGAIGYFGYNGESQFNIAIRSAVFEKGTASFHVGAGIVADSVPENEWQETLDKAAGLLLPSQNRNG